MKKLSLELDTSTESLNREMERIEKKESIKSDTFVVKKDKRSRQEVLEEYLLSLIVQNSNPKSLLEKALSILSNYKFQIISYQKIVDFLLNYFKGKIVFNAKDFLNTLPQELLASFDTCYLFPLPRFTDEKTLILEIEKVAVELRTFFLKNRIKEISDSLKKGEKEDPAHMGVLEEELSNIVRLLPHGNNVVK